MAGFWGTAMVRDRATSVIIEFVPVEHSPDALAENRRIKCNSGLDEASLTSTRWIKPPQRHTLCQKAAHLIARFRTNKVANEAINEGLVIVGKRVWARQMQKEPRRCLRCQSLTAKHLAMECDQQAACRTCGKDHRAVECTETDREAFWCMSCNVSGHASWDRLCLGFLAASK